MSGPSERDRQMAQAILSGMTPVVIRHFSYPDEVRAALERRTEMLLALFAAARAEERQRCAKIARRYIHDPVPGDTASKIAEEIESEIDT